MSTKNVMDGGGIVIELMVDNWGDPVGGIDGWIKSYDLNGSVFHDKDGKSRTALTADGKDREWAFIVDLSNMKVVWRGFGSLGGTGQNFTVDDYASAQGLVEMCKPAYLNCP